MKLDSKINAFIEMSNMPAVKHIRPQSQEERDNILQYEKRIASVTNIPVIIINDSDYHAYVIFSDRYMVDLGVIMNVAERGGDANKTAAWLCIIYETLYKLVGRLLEENQILTLKLHKMNNGENGDINGK